MALCKYLKSFNRRVSRVRCPSFKRDGHPLIKTITTLVSVQVIRYSECKLIVVTRNNNNNNISKYLPQ